MTQSIPLRATLIGDGHQSNCDFARRQIDQFDPNDFEADKPQWIRVNRELDQWYKDYQHIFQRIAPKLLINGYPSERRRTQGMITDIAHRASTPGLRPPTSTDPNPAFAMQPTGPGSLAVESDLALQSQVVQAKATDGMLLSLRVKAGAVHFNRAFVLPIDLGLLAYSQQERITRAHADLLNWFGHHMDGLINLEMDGLIRGRLASSLQTLGVLIHLDHVSLDPEHTAADDPRSRFEIRAVAAALVPVGSNEVLIKAGRTQGEWAPGEVRLEGTPVALYVTAHFARFVQTLRLPLPEIHVEAGSFSHRELDWAKGLGIARHHQFEEPPPFVGQYTCAILCC